MKSNFVFGLMLALAVPAVTACGTDDADTDTTRGGAGGASGDRAASAGSAGHGGASTAGNFGGDTATLNDAQILKVVSTANDGEVMAAQAAKPALKNAALLDFAEMMIDEHGAANEEALALVSSKHLTPEPSDVSESLEADAEALLKALSAAPATAIDKVYIEGQVAAHQEVLSLIDSRLMRDATDADLKSLLGSVRDTVATHLSSAQTISATLP